MAEWRMGLIESRFADIIWNNEPVSSTQLVKLAGEALGWKKSTTYTVLKRLCDRGIFQNQNGTVTALLSREEFQARQSEEFIADSFGGSLVRGAQEAERGGAPAAAGAHRPEQGVSQPC